jgi:hypothetical protein
MSVKIFPNNNDRKVQRIHPLNHFLVALSKLGVLQTEFKLFSGRTMVLVLWSLFPLLTNFSLFYPPTENSSSDLVLTFSNMACNLLLTFWDAMIPVCLVYFFFNNPDVAAELLYLPAPKKLGLLSVTDIVGAIYGGFFCYSIIVGMPQIGLESFLSVLMLFGAVYDVILKFCFIQVVGSTVERFQKLSVSYESSQSLQLSLNNDSYQFAVKRSMETVNEYSKIKQGLGPLLFVTITTNMIIMVMSIFMILRESSSSYSIANFLFSLNSLFILFYVIQVCDDAHEALISMAEITRQLI